jgi:uncharacterized membrane protein (UPF0136 family)
MSLVNYTILFYGLIIIAGGVIGFLKSKSKISLLSGLISGIVMLLSYYLVISLNSAGYYISLIISLILLIIFFLRYKKTGKFIPSGLLIILSTVTFTILLIYIIRYL